MTIMPVSGRLLLLRAIDEANKELRERNEIRLKAAKEAMGAKYLLHPDNAMSKEKFRKMSRIVMK